MGFDVFYFLLIYFIGCIYCKGCNNFLCVEVGDFGSLYVIGSEEGGYEVIYFELGDCEDFCWLFVVVCEYGMELVLDFVIQCFFDYFWLCEYFGWFVWCLDGSLCYVENLLKKYEDIVNVDFYVEQVLLSLWEVLCDVVLGWVEQGVMLFCVDNLYIKLLLFWEWLIVEVCGCYLQVIFFFEVFICLVMMVCLGKVGFSQSYIYFIWCNDKQELVEYFVEFNQLFWCDCYWLNFFVNILDINFWFL